MQVPSLELEYHDSVPVARIAGDVDVAMAARVQDRLLGGVRNEDAGLVVDLSEVTYIDSAGINVLFELAERLDARQLRLGVVVPDGSLVERVLRIVDIGSVAVVARTLADALTGVRTGDER